MQPTFLPWLGYFALINEVDKFVFLDNVQFNKRSWQQRNQIINNDKVCWISVPVYSKGKKDYKINQIKINFEHYYPKKILGTIYHSYKKTKYFEYLNENLIKILNKKNIYLSDLNINLIKFICKELLINDKFINSSDLEITGKKDELIFNICSNLNASKYISPAGSKIYLSESKFFSSSKIELEYFSYSHPIYNQKSAKFIPNLSIVDLVFNEGFKKAREII